MSEERKCPCCGQPMPSVGAHGERATPPDPGDGAPYASSIEIGLITVSSLSMKFGPLEAPAAAPKILIWERTAL